jgi:colanic acid/amylovoran biosynthesis glycosyltransferase
VLALAESSPTRCWTIFHGYDVSSYVQKYGAGAYAPLFALGDRFLAVSQLWMARLKELGCPEDRIALLRMGIDVNRIPFLERKPAAMLRVLSVGRLTEKKGFEYALRALAELTRLRPTLDWAYEIVGEGRLRRSLDRLSRKLGIHERVSFVGRLPAEAVLTKLATSDIFILPSVTARSGDMEGIPVSLMEAMASGAPVLSTFHSGIPELIDDGVSGLLAPERDIAALARNLCVLTDQPDLRLSMAVAARRKVELKFDQERITDELVSDIAEALTVDRFP